MGKIELSEMTLDTCRDFYREFENDPDIFMDMRTFTKYIYSEEKADAYYKRAQAKGRILLAILLDGVPIGEIQLKDIHPGACCTLGIHMQNDSVKGKGYGTQAERLALDYAFRNLNMKTVYADTVLKNRRSRHVLEKVGFTYVRSDELFHYYKYDRKDWLLVNGKS